MSHDASNARHPPTTTTNVATNVEFCALAYHASDMTLDVAPEFVNTARKQGVTALYDLARCRRDNLRVPPTYHIQVFGRDAEGHKYNLIVLGFRPYFCVKTDPRFMANDAWLARWQKMFVNHLQLRAEYAPDLVPDLVQVSVAQGMDLYGYRGEQSADYMCSFLKVSCLNMATFRKLREIWHGQYHAAGTPFDASKHASCLQGKKLTLPSGRGFARPTEVPSTSIYESTLPPQLRFLHEQHLKPSGWLRAEDVGRLGTAVNGDMFAAGDHGDAVARYAWDAVPERTTRSLFVPAAKDRRLLQHNVYTVAPRVTPIVRDVCVPFVIASWDIEASSSHGDFPLPVKNYHKLGDNLLEHFSKHPEVLQRPPEEVYAYVRNLIRTAFGVSGAPGRWIERVYPKDHMLGRRRWSLMDDDERRALVDEWAHQWMTKSVTTLLDDYLAHPDFAAKCVDNMFDMKKYDKQSEFGQMDSIEDTLMVEMNQNDAEDAPAMENDDEGDAKDEADDDDDAPADDEDVGEPDSAAMLSGESRADAASSVAADSLNLTVHLSSLHNAQAVQMTSKFYAARGGPTTVLNILADRSKRATKLRDLVMTLDAVFPRLEGDRITFIGTTFMRNGEVTPYLNHCIVDGECDPVDGALIVSASSEAEVLMQWKKVLLEEDPDVIIGYNVFGFDYPFVAARMNEFGLGFDFLHLSKMEHHVCGTPIADEKFRRLTYAERQSTANLRSARYAIRSKLNSTFSKKQDVHYVDIPGRIQFDLLKYYQSRIATNSYKLDAIAGKYIGDNIKSAEPWSAAPDAAPTGTRLDTKNLTGIAVGNYVHIEILGNSVQNFKTARGSKFEVCVVNEAEKYLVVNQVLALPEKSKKRWCLAKDDIDHKDIFRLSSSGLASDRAIVAKYCVQDCNLVQNLFRKSDVLTEHIEMSNVSLVPVDTLVMRGQGIKSLSLVAYECRAHDPPIYMPDVDGSGDRRGYNGAIVLDPKTGVYMDDPVAVNDYASLYPSSQCSENLSHDTKVWSKQYDLKGQLTHINDEPVERWYPTDGRPPDESWRKYEALPGMEYVDKEYETYRYAITGNSTKLRKVVSGRRVCRFVQFPGERRGILPTILQKLLGARKSTRAKQKGEKDPFMWQLLEQRQLSYKVTANSLYGICGAHTSPIRDVDVAACTAATGRTMLIFSKHMIEACYRNRVCETKCHGAVRVNAEYVYGDTDSVFYKFNPRELDGTPIRGKPALAITIELATQLGEIAAEMLKAPHDFEYEKTFMPFCLFSKKRYIGMLYERDLNECKRKEMGVALKRNDNAPIVKDVFGGVIDVLLIKQNLTAMVDYLRECLEKLLRQEYPVESLIVTVGLVSHYVHPERTRQKVLVDRIDAREPGSAPRPGDRVKFMFVDPSCIPVNAELPPKKTILQGNRIEAPEYVLEHRLPIDHSYYISNQLMAPIQQLLAMVIEQIWEAEGQSARIPKLRALQKAETDKLVAKYEYAYAWVQEMWLLRAEFPEDADAVPARKPPPKDMLKRFEQCTSVAEVETKYRELAKDVLPEKIREKMSKLCMAAVKEYIFDSYIHRSNPVLAQKAADKAAMLVKREEKKAAAAARALLPAATRKRPVPKPAPAPAGPHRAMPTESGVIGVDLLQSSASSSPSKPAATLPSLWRIPGTSNQASSALQRCLNRQRELSAQDEDAKRAKRREKDAERRAAKRAAEKESMDAAIATAVAAALAAAGKTPPNTDAAVLPTPPATKRARVVVSRPAALDANPACTPCALTPV